MSTEAATAAHDGKHDHHHPELNFWRKYVFSTDHKVIGIQFLFSALFFFTLGGILAWERFRPSSLKMIPGALVGVAAAVALAAAAGLPGSAPTWRGRRPPGRGRNAPYRTAGPRPAEPPAWP